MPTWPNLRNGSVGPEVGDRQPLVVGEAPAPSSDPSAEPLLGRSSRWLARLLGTSYDDLRRRARFVNLLPVYPGRRFPIGAGRAAARSLVARREVARASVLVLLGRGVAASFGCADRSFLESFEVDETRAVVIPHPSGLNRWWSDVTNRERARVTLAPILGGA